MKNALWMLLAAALLLSGCSPGGAAEPAPTPTVAAATPAPLAQDGRQPLAPVALADPPASDLTLLSNTMAYAELFNIAVNIREHEGKTIKLRGAYYAIQSAETGQVEHVLLVADQAACCEIGLEFRVTGTHSYPEDFPPNLSTIELVGLLGINMIGDYPYPVLTVNEVTLIETPTWPS